MAPAVPAFALVGPGPTEVASVLAWDSAEAAALLAEDAPLPASLSSALATCDAAVVYSRSATLARRLTAVIPRVVVRDPQPPPNAGHAAAWYLGALHELGVPAPMQTPPSVQPTTGERAEADRHVHGLRDQFLAIHPGSGSPAKNWPAAHLAAVANLLSPGRAFALIEGPADRGPVAAVHALAPHGLLLRDLPLRTLGAVLARAGLYVGNDSGVSHLAAAYGTSCLVVFGPTDPVVWSPVGPRVATLRFEP